jgi:hypothetical protein
MSYKIQIYIPGLKVNKWVSVSGITSSQKEAQAFNSREQAEFTAKAYCKKYKWSENQLIIKDSKAAKSKQLNHPVWIYPNDDDLYDAVAGKERPNGVEYFPSKLEARVFLILRKVIGVKNFTSQFAVEVKPKTEVYKPIYWKVDFKIHEPFTLIEAKGESLPEFKRNLQYLQFFNPINFGQLIVVKTEREKIDSAIYSMGLKEFEEHLMRIK